MPAQGNARGSVAQARPPPWAEWKRGPFPPPTRFERMGAGKPRNRAPQPRTYGLVPFVVDPFTISGLSVHPLLAHGVRPPGREEDRATMDHCTSGYRA